MTSRPPRRRPFQRAAALLLVQGALMEGLVFVGLIVLVALGLPQETATTNAQVFALPYLQENVYLMMVMSGIFATLRITGAVALWRGRMWGLALTLINCVVTLALMIFWLPAGIADGILSGTALVLILRGWLGNRMIDEPKA